MNNTSVTKTSSVTLDKEELSKKYGTEQVFVVPYFFTQEIPDKYTEINESDKKEKELDISQGKYIYRYDAEGQNALQQIIPCCVILDEKRNVFVTKRKKGDSRLQGNLSVIFGGHINPCDGYKNPIENCLKRELSEELTIENIPEKFLIYEKKAYIRDLSSSTNDHLGILYVFNLPKGYKKKLMIKENDTLEGKWFNSDELKKRYFEFESWGKIIISEIIYGKI